MALIAKELDFPDSEHGLLHLEKRIMLDTSANDELDSLKELSTIIDKYQHIIMNQEDPVFIVFKDIVYDFHPLASSRRRAFLYKDRLELTPWSSDR